MSYVDPESYPVPIEINDWNIHPTGIPLAWEGEYEFDDRVSIAEIGDAVQQFYGSSLTQGWPTLLPVRELHDVPCRFTLMPRFF